MTEAELIEMGRQVETLGRRLVDRADTSVEARLMHRQMRCSFFALAALFYGTPEAHALAEEARRSVLDLEAVLV